MDLRFYLSLFLKRLHWFILIVVLFSVLGVMLARIMPTVYRAEARLLVETEQIPGNLAASTVQVQALEQLQIIQQRILTRDILVEMANRLDIYADRREAGKPMLEAEEIVQDLKKRIVISISGAAPAQQRGQVQATIVTVSFFAPNSRLAAEVTNEVVTLILREDVAMRTGVARQTLEFFKAEVARLDKILSQKSAAILEFKERNISSLPDSLDFRRSRQAATQERLTQLERQDAEMRDRRDRMVLLNASAQTASDLIPMRERSGEQQQLQQIKDERSKLIAVLSPENPRVKLLDQQISALERIVAEQVAELSMGAQGIPMSAFDIQLADLDGQLTYLEQQKLQLQSEMSELTASIAETPSNAIALEALERDYAAVTEQYKLAVSNKARAETGDTIEALSKGQRITVIEPAIPPRDPSSPNRPMIAAAGVGGGMFAALGLIGLLEALKSGIRRPADLTTGLGITAFATLPYLRSRGELFRQQLFIWGGVTVLLVSVAGGVWAIHTFFMPLDLLVDQIKRRLG